MSFFCITKCIHACRNETIGNDKNGKYELEFCCEFRDSCENFKNGCKRILVL